MRFGPFRLEPDQRRLLRDEEPVKLGARAFDLLLTLIERRDRTVSRDEQFEQVWPGRVVEDDNLEVQVMALRKALGPAAIATIPGRGYRFAARLETDTSNAGANAASAVVPAPDPSAPTPRTNLPLELPVLLGRDDDMAALCALVDRHRLVSIVGAGGIGKSLLAQHLLQGHRRAYAHGVCWVELAPLADAAALPGAVAAALGVGAVGSEPLAALTAVVAPLSMLMALDNAEHLHAAVAALCEQVHACAPGLRLVVTSQVPLHAAAERVYRATPRPRGNSWRCT